MRTKGILLRLQDKWGLTSVKEVLLVLFVFALTGTTVMWLKYPILDYFKGDTANTWVINTIYYIMIFPVYNILLLFYAFLFGRFSFFWNYEARMFKRMFRHKKKAV